MWTAFKADMNHIALSILGNSNEPTPKYDVLERRLSVESIQSNGSGDSFDSFDNCSVTSETPSLVSDFSEDYTQGSNRKRANRYRLATSDSTGDHPLSEPYCSENKNGTLEKDLNKPIEMNEIELEVFNIQTLQVPLDRKLRYRRNNSDYYRVLVAKRQMYAHGKLNFIRCPTTKPAKCDLSPEELKCASLFNTPDTKVNQHRPRAWECISRHDLRRSN